MVVFIDNYDNLTVEEVEEQLREESYTANQLSELQEYESRHKDRKGVLDVVEEELEELTPVPEPENQNEISPDAGASDAPERVVIRPADGTTRYVEGVWFDDPSEPQEVDYTPRVERAVEEGRAELVDED